MSFLLNSKAGLTSSLVEENAETKETEPELGDDDGVREHHALTFREEAVDNDMLEGQQELAKSNGKDSIDGDYPIPEHFCKIHYIF
jgi:hypothetical protein